MESPEWQPRSREVFWSGARSQNFDGGRLPPSGSVVVRWRFSPPTRAASAFRIPHPGDIAFLISDKFVQLGLGPIGSHLYGRRNLDDNFGHARGWFHGWPQGGRRVGVGIHWRILRVPPAARARR